MRLRCLLFAVFLPCAAATAAGATQGGPVTVAVCPAIPAPGASEETAELITQALVVAASGLPHTTVVDRSAFAQLCAEQDILLVSQWTASRDRVRNMLGADEMLISTVISDGPQVLISARRVDVASGKVLAATLRREVQSRARLERTCGLIVATLFKPTGEVTSTASPENRDIESLWRMIDQPEARRLIGSEVERAASVYRQYVSGELSSTQRGDRESTVVSYLTDCVAALQRVQNPPTGMVFVPEGNVEIVYPGAEPRRFFVSGFFIDKYPYTRGQYADFLERTGSTPVSGWSGPGDGGGLPMVEVSWDEAGAIALWRGMELPTYAQWVRAVSGDGKQAYPWGDRWQPNLCNYAADPGRPVLQEVGRYPEGRSRYGVFDGAGCVFEWLFTGHDAEYWQHAPLVDPRGPSSAATVVTVGGSYRSGPAACSCRYIHPLPPGVRKDDVGFRCVLALK